MSSSNDFCGKASSCTAQKIPLYHRVVSATIGSIINAAVVTPLDVVKTRLQSQDLVSQAQNLTQHFNSRPSYYQYPNHRSNILRSNLSPLSIKDFSLSSGRNLSIPFLLTTSILDPGSLSRRSSPFKNLCACDRMIFTRNYVNCISSTSTSALSGSARSAPSALHLNGTMDGILKIARYEGWPKLWSGYSPTLVMAIPANVIYFISYENLRDYLEKFFPPSDYVLPVNSLLAGSLARSVAASVISPIELVRTRVQSANAVGGLAEVIREVVSVVKVRGSVVLWRGLVPTLMRDIPFSGLYWMGYETVLKRCFSNNQSSAPSNAFAQSFVAGALSGMVAAVLTTPFDVAKTRRQTTSYDIRKGSSTLPPKSTFSIFKQVVQAEGWKGLWRGVVPRAGKVAPSCAIMISTYEASKRFFGPV